MEKIQVKHITNEKEEIKEIEIDKEYLKYNIKTITLRGEFKILYYNFNEIEFYQKRLEKPKIKIWIIRRNIKLNYCTKRLIEEGYKMNIQIEDKNVPFFDFILNENKIFYKNEEIKNNDLPDIILPRMGATIDYFGLSLIQQFELMGIKILNNYSSLEISKDKLKTYQILSSKKLNIPKTLLCKIPFESKDLLFKEFSLPLILKSISGSQGKGILKIDNINEIEDILSIINIKNNYIFQNFIKESSGKDIRIIVINNKVIGAMIRKNKGYKSNIHQGAIGYPIQISKELEEYSIHIAKAIGLVICGIDLLIGEDSYYVCEVNSSPGFEGFEKSVGVNIAKELLDYILSNQ